MEQNLCQQNKKGDKANLKGRTLMKLKVCLLVILGFFGCQKKTEEQVELEEIVKIENNREQEFK